MSQQTLFEIGEQTVEKGSVVLRKGSDEELVVLKTYDHCRDGERMALYVPKWAWQKGRSSVHGCCLIRKLSKANQNPQ